MNTIRHLSRQKTQTAGREILTEYHASLPWYAFRLKSKVRRVAANPVAAGLALEEIDKRVGKFPRPPSSAVISKYSFSLNSLASKLAANANEPQESFLDRLLRMFQWILEHKDEIRAIIDLFS